MQNEKKKDSVHIVLDAISGDRKQRAHDEIDCNKTILITKQYLDEKRYEVRTGIMGRCSKEEIVNTFFQGICKGAEVFANEYSAKPQIACEMYEDMLFTLAVSLLNQCRNRGPFEIVEKNVASKSAQYLS